MAFTPTPLPNTFIQQGKFPKIWTKNLTPGKTFFDQEYTTTEDNVEYRELDPRHSKLGAALARGCQQFGIKEGETMLYLGASHGYTPSFVSDMMGPKATIFCLDIAPRVVRDLVFVAEERVNMIPILENAAVPESYAWRITGVDVIFQDIAQRNQVEIFLKNCQLYLKPGGFGMLALKARSVDVLKRPADVFRDVKKELDNTPGFTIVDYRELDPFEKDHAFFVVKRKA
jgi:fibrillarin-like pre-rRNA processing protein